MEVSRREPPARRLGWYSVLLAVRLASAIVFITFGVGKFVNHASETASFQTYGLPDPGLFTIVIGVVELVGGFAVLATGVIRLFAIIALAGDMVGAIVLSGVLHGEKISLTLAPALLLSMIVIGTVEFRSRRCASHLARRPS